MRRRHRRNPRRRQSGGFKVDASTLLILGAIYLYVSNRTMDGVVQYSAPIGPPSPGGDFFAQPSAWGTGPI
jgi:hypothetical protein